MDEIALFPLVAAPLGISAERPFPVYVGFNGNVPDIIRDAEDFAVSLVAEDGNLRFENGEMGIIVPIRGAKGQAMAKLSKPVRSVRLHAYFLFNNRYSGKVEVTLRELVPPHDAAPSHI